MNQDQAEHGAYAGVIDVARNGVDEVIRLRAECDALRARIAELERERLQSRLLSAGNNMRGETDLDAEG